MNARILHDGSFIRPGGSARVAREFARALDAPVTIGHTADRSFWDGVDAEFPFQSEFHKGMSGRIWGRLPKQYAEFRVGQRFRELNVNEDIIVSTSTMSKWIVPKYHQTHVNYCHVPPPHFYGIPKSGVFDWVKSLGLGMVDQHFTTFVDQIIANSEFTRTRIARHYRVDAPVLHPPVRVDQFHHERPRDPPYFVMVCRLVSMKRPELVAQAFEPLDVDLIIVGSGPLADTVKAYDGVTVRSGLEDDEVEEVVARSIGGVAFAELEHCGLTPKEFQAAGKPVLVPDEPNLRNHVVDGENGAVVPVSVAGIRDGVRRILEGTWEPNRIQTAAADWNRDAFAERARTLVQDAVEEQR